MSKAPYDLEGKKFGRLLVLEPVKVKSNNGGRLDADRLWALVVAVRRVMPKTPVRLVANQRERV